MIGFPGRVFGEVEADLNVAALVIKLILVGPSFFGFFNV